MSTKQQKCTIRILDEVHCVLIGLMPEHVKYFYNEYSAHVPGYFFNPKFKLGSWDGKVHYFSNTGKTYVNLLEDIIPRVVGLKYSIEIVDLRQTIPIEPPVIDKDFFSNIINPETDQPWEMRPYQVEMVNTLLSSGAGVGIAGTGAGKDQPLYSKILTPTGWRCMGDLRVGDQVITPSGKVANIVGVFPQGERDVYEIKFHDGATTRCGIGHLWKVKFPKQLHKACTEDCVVETSEIISFLARKRSKIYTPGNISVSLVDPIEFGTVPLLIDPYLLGVLIGDGTLRSSPTISSADSYIIERVSTLVERFNLHVLHRGGVDYGLVKREAQNSFPPSSNALTEQLRTLGLHGKKSFEKFIPDSYKRSSIDQRLELIRGLFDTDGTVDRRGNISFTSTSLTLAKDVQEVIWSLGGTCTITSRRPKYTYNNERRIGRTTYTCFIRHPTPNQLFALERKRVRCRGMHADGRIELTRRIVSVEKVETSPTQCIMIDDPEHLYITDDYIVTHNTSMTAAICLAYEHAADLRSIIIVPDKNLTDQTCREYMFFGLDVGEYSGTRKDIQHQHIVSTWQALKNNPNILHDVQVIIVDEAHGLRGKVLNELLNEHGKNIAYRFGVTGTLPKEPADALAVRVSVGSVKYTKHAHELIDQGFLAKLHIDIFQMDVNLKDQYETYLAEEVGPLEKPLTYAKFKDVYFPDWAAEKRFMQTNKDQLQWVVDLIETKRDSGKGNVFCLVDGIAYGKKLTAAIPGAIFVYGKDPMEDRKQVYQLFKEHNNLVVIANVQVASTGLDIKRIFNMMYINVGRSFIRVIQSIGRGLRKAPDKDFVHVSDVCTDLKYSRKHLTERTKYYTEAKYPYKKHKIII